MSDRVFCVYTSYSKADPHVFAITALHYALQQAEIVIGPCLTVLMEAMLLPGCYLHLGKSLELQIVIEQAHL